MGPHIPVLRMGMIKPTTIIAEIGVNHNGNLSLAKQLVNAVALAGADVVKFQTFKATDLATPEAPKADYQQSATAAQDQLSMLQSLELSLEHHRTLAKLSETVSLQFLSTAFDEASLDLLDEFNLPFNKIPSGEVTNKPFLEHVAAKRKPIVMSTGMCTLTEVESAMEVLSQNGVRVEDITLLKCTTDYPTAPEDANLRGMLTLKQEFGTSVGFSDHTAGIEIALAAVAMGASVLEKHVTLDRSLPGPDHAASIEPYELERMVNGIRNIQKAFGSSKLSPTATELNNRTAARKSIHLLENTPEGVVLQRKHLSMKRPGDGISPMEIDRVIGCTLKRPLPLHHKLSWEDIQ